MANASEEILEIKVDLLDGMRDFMQGVLEDGDDPGYTDADVVQCEALIDAFLARVAAAPTGDPNVVMDAVRDVVLALNKLNDHSDGSLIETDQRESLCELIMRAAAAAGVGDGNEDITEEWREW